MIYVDNAFKKYKGMIMCHLVADTLNELHNFANDKLGCKASWFQDKKFPHYDIPLSKRKITVKYGAWEITTKELVRIIKKQRNGI